MSLLLLLLLPAAPTAPALVANKGPTCCLLA
jgi:hypothetical protein